MSFSDAEFKFLGFTQEEIENHLPTNSEAESIVHSLLEELICNKYHFDPMNEKLIDSNQKVVR